MKIWAVCILLGLPLAGCVEDQAYQGVRPELATGSLRPSSSFGQKGQASYYSLAGRRTASGQIANPSGMTAAHRSLPFGTMVEVTNLKNGRSVVVRINDRGPFVRGRIIDVTTAAARSLGMDGVAPVSISVINGPQLAAR